MNWVSWFGCLVAAFICTLGVVRYLINHAGKINLLDIPNERSSHTTPTPRGGGLPIAVSITLPVILISAGNSGEDQSLLWFGISLFAIALIAIIDDLKDGGLSAVLRAGLYFLISGYFVITIFLSSAHDNYGYLLLLFCGLLIAWATNLYNFMDGADGLAALQVIIVVMPAGVIFYMLNHLNLALLCFIAVSSTMGFLAFNWPPAKIFMGDVGSCTIGFFIAGLAFISFTQNIFSVYIWLILHSLFIVDASLTLLKRILTEKKWYRAHRGHAYQRYLLLGHNHRQLAIRVLVISLFIIWPLAFLAYQNQQYMLHITMIVYMIWSGIWYFIQLNYRGLGLGD